MALAKEYSSRRVCHGTLGEIEAAMLYLLVRVSKPRRVLEVGALCGYSTRWLLSALARNDYGRLESYDLQNVVDGIISEHRDRWTFTRADVTNLDLGDFDLIFIDALHMNAFAKMYTRRILAPVARATPVVIHDIYNPLMMPLYAPCRRLNASDTAALYDLHMDCFRRLAANWTRAHPGNDFLYGPEQTSGEGQELLAWLARTSRTASPIINFQPYNAPLFALGLRDLYLRLGILNPDCPYNQPAAFFLLRGAGDQSASSDIQYFDPSSINVADAKHAAAKRKKRGRLGSSKAQF
ncbi:hypothetical protein CTAYLR_009182 [Chrysophaeum taylorii]|uniref:Uncharacterized protein n=1 Tax=Chrysophaeum taylorii TaxID=2483200 RepID=A0AAD7XNR7_9STRA|nr:hypothetical protein CTAYLR_009182 [Chrysophaeum taylorii]